MTSTPPVNQLSPAAEKIALFARLFRGREDVYPRRFESRKTGRSGYSPACANEWVRGVCDKRACKCSDCPQRRFLPVNDETIRQHLSGRDPSAREFVMGLYPMLLDETCYFLAADFDKKNWREDVLAVAETCRRLGIPAAMERSRSGNGGHLWIFFEEALPAVLARKLGAYVLTETMERRPDIGLDSYDRFFPNQDTLPKGGFGNLIALPLQKRPRAQGHSVFLDGQLSPWADQWAFLSTIQKLDRGTVERIVRAAEVRDRVVGVRLASMEEDDDAPWTAPPSRRRDERPITDPLPECLELVLGDEIYLAKEGLPPALRNRLLRLAAFQNPEFYQAQAMRLPTFDKPRVIACAEDLPLHIALPRGCMEDVQALLTGLEIKYTLRDERNPGEPLAVAFHGTLRLEQRAAAEALLAHDDGILAATTAFGKTVLAAWLIAQRGVNTLVLVHRQQLLEQWVERLSVFLGMPAKSIGRIGGGKRKPTGLLDVALIQSLARKGVVDDRVGTYGQLVVDECHHLPAYSFEQVARRAKAKYILGLSATVIRKDGHHPILFMQCGPVRYRVNAKQQAAARPFTHSVLVRPTAFQPPSSTPQDARIQFHDLYTALIADESRNRLICEDVIAAVKAGRSPVVLTERTNHLEKLAARLAPAVRHLIILQGGMGRKKLREVLAQLAAVAEQEERVVLATGRYLGEGFDDARLDTLYLTLPVSWRGTIAQYAGRLHRSHEGKREVRIYDYADLNVPLLARMFDRRCKGYEAIGYTLLLPASAVPGWPADVPLPIETEWKRDYAASVQRLVRDGVDSPLGNLFVHATRAFQAAAQGVERARSATEAFLYRRLETLAATSGKFQLNVALPIPFAGRSCLEVDLLCAEARVAVELDGPQHLADHDAYRRDRRKDALLQEHGFFVLRFLAEDVGKELDQVLDAILRVLVHQQRQLTVPARALCQPVVDNPSQSNNYSTMNDILSEHIYGSVRAQLQRRLAEPAPGHVQLLFGPRQVGKTTLLLELQKAWGAQAIYAAADTPAAALPGWWEQLWHQAQQLAASGQAVLLLDEVHFIGDWSRKLKHQADELRRRQIPLHVVATGSSSLQLGAGARESMAGRFERLRLLHWPAAALASQFKLSKAEALLHFVRHGGYPGAVPLLNDEGRWRQYVRESIVEPAIGRDMQVLEKIRRPSLLRQVYAICAHYPAEILSLQKISGRLTDKGALETIAHYLHLMEEAALVAALPKYSHAMVRQRAAPPKLIALNQAFLATATDQPAPLPEREPEQWGRWIENACIALAWNAGQQIWYWREEPWEVDMILSGSWGQWAVEVKTGAFGSNDLAGLSEFCRRHRDFQPLVLCDATCKNVALSAGMQAMSWEDYLWSGLHP